MTKYITISSIYDDAHSELVQRVLEKYQPRQVHYSGSIIYYVELDDVDATFIGCRHGLTFHREPDN